MDHGSRPIDPSSTGNPFDPRPIAISGTNYFKAINYLLYSAVFSYELTISSNLNERTENKTTNLRAKKSNKKQ